MSVEYSDAFELMLGRTLRAHVDANRGPRPLPEQARYQAAQAAAGRHMSLLGKAAAMVTTKAAVGVFVGAAAVFAAGAGEAVITGSGNPVRWVSQLGQQAQKCGSAVVPGSGGAGDCLGSFAARHVVRPVRGLNNTAAGSSGGSDRSHGAVAGKTSGGPTTTPGQGASSGGQPASGQRSGGNGQGGGPSSPSTAVHGKSAQPHGNSAAHVHATPPPKSHRK